MTLYPVQQDGGHGGGLLFGKCLGQQVEYMSDARLWWAFFGGATRRRDVIPSLLGWDGQRHGTGTAHIREPGLSASHPACLLCMFTIAPSLAPAISPTHLNSASEPSRLSASHQCHHRHRSANQTPPSAQGPTEGSSAKPIASN